MAGEYCEISGKCVDGTGAAIRRVKVSAYVIGEKAIFIDADGVKYSVSSDPVRTTSGSDGSWTLTLIRSKFLYRSTVSGIKYSISLLGRGIDETKEVTVPDAATASYEDL